MSTIVRDWAELPMPPLSTIADKLDFPPDYVRFRSVCSMWRSAVPCRRYLPMLLLHRRPETEEEPSDFPKLKTIFSFSALSTDPEITSQLPLQQQHQEGKIEEPRSIRDLSTLEISAEGGVITSLPFPPAVLGVPCCGSSHGWLALLHPTALVSLFNPLTNARISLPPFATFFKDDNDRYTWTKLNDAGEFLSTNNTTGETLLHSFNDMARFIARKIILSSDPSSGSFIALAIRFRFNQVDFCRLGDQEWTPINHSTIFNSFTIDAQFYKGSFFISSGLAIYNLDLSDKDVRLIDNPGINNVSVLEEIDESYLVESAGDLLLVTLFYKISGYEAMVYKVVWVENNVIKLVKLDDFGGRTLFIGLNRCFSLKASDYPGLLGDAIYMVEYYQSECRSDRDMIRVIRMPDCINTLLPFSLSMPRSSWVPSAWFIPSLL